MELGSPRDRPLGVVLVEQGLVTDEDVDNALAVQAKTSQPLGEILIQRALIARAMLARALAAQGGVSLEEEGGFGTGLMAKIEQLHLIRRGLPIEEPGVETETLDEANGFDPEVHPHEPVVAELELLRQREEELDARERELAKHEARLARKERKLARAAGKAVPARPTV